MRKVFLATAILFFPSLASAHGVGQLYALPIPLKYYLGAAGLAVALSFFIFAFFLSSSKSSIPNEKVFFAGWLSPIISILRVIVLFFLLLMILTGIFGEQSAIHNISPIFFWVFWLLGFGILSLFIGNIWDKLNPWKFLQELFGFKSGNKTISAWVGVVLVLCVYWFELSSGVSFIPKAVGGAFLIYTILSLFCASIFSNWFENGELFSVYFRFVGRLAFFRIGDDNKSIIYSPQGHRLSGQIFSWSTVGLAAVFLAGTSFDSFKETILWFRMLNHLHLASNIFTNTLGLILFPIPFAIIFLVLMWLMQKMTATSDWKALSKQFVIALIPIAFGYTLAHNFSLVIVSAPQVLGLFSDPFGFGWNILHTSTLATYSLVLGAKPIWFIEIGFVVAAHIIATLYAHILATRVMPNPKKVFVSQFPTLILMVAFTVTTLWLLAQPLVISK